MTLKPVLVSFVAALTLCGCSQLQIAPTVPVGPPPGLVAEVNEAAGTARFVNANWYTGGPDGVNFIKGERCQVAGVFVDECPADAPIVELAGAFIIPALGDAHNHNLDGPWTQARAAQYIAHGVFYLRNLNSVISVDTWAAEAWETADSVDIAWAHAGISTDEGHPETLYRRIANVYRLDPEKLEGDVFWDAPDTATLEAKWPSILDTKPDWIKLYLIYTQDEDIKPLSGLRREVFARAVELSHQSGLKAIVHVNTAEDFATAISLGADGAAHLPPTYVNVRDDDSIFRLTPDMAAAAAAANFVTTPTVSVVESFRGDESAATISIIERTREMQADNLRLLRAAGAPIALGSDLYEGDAVDELMALAARDVFSNVELLRIAVETPSIAIFPNRAIGTLQPGWEASFLALDCDPRTDIKCMTTLSLAIKQGQAVFPAAVD